MRNVWAWLVAVYLGGILLQVGLCKGASTRIKNLYESGRFSREDAAMWIEHLRFEKKDYLDACLWPIWLFKIVVIEHIEHLLKKGKRNG